MVKRVIYGPVPSWRLGRSLGIDLLSTREKVCSFNCIYCQLGETKVLTTQRQVFVPTERVLEEWAQLPPVDFDVVTFSGTGEPTLAANLSECAVAISKLCRHPIAILTNASLMSRKDVRDELSHFDIVVAKLDAPNEELFFKINRPANGVRFEHVLEGISAFAEMYPQKLVLQIMFVEANFKFASEMAKLARGIGAREIQLNTPLRPSKTPPLSRGEMEIVKQQFTGLKVTCVYDAQRVKAEPIDAEQTKLRRPTL